MTIPVRGVSSWLVADVGGVRIALPADRVGEVLRSVALTPVPGAPQLIEGTLNLRGELLPVVDLRALLGVPARRNRPSDSLIVLTASGRRIAVRVDSADDLEEVVVDEVESPAALSPALAGTRGLAGVATRDDGALVMYDPDAFLTRAERDALDLATRGAS